PFQVVAYEAEIEENRPRRLRGGAFFNDLRYGRAACRLGDLPDVRGSSIGFRVAEHLSISGF
ncbi:MAG: hypothetical protein KC423_27905, partial [Anaerolineales bacterium]|nr:hypothetical protein [Anaerolineales bacterium]